MHLDCSHDWNMLVGMTIFQKTRLRPTQLRTVAERRFDDANALRRTGDNARANGAMYLGGFVIECLLKAMLLEKFGWLGSTGSPEGRNEDDRRLWSLCYRSHDLSELLKHLPEVMEKLEQRGAGSGQPPRAEASRLAQSLKSVCSQWTIHARYSPRSADIDEARDFLDKVKDLKSCLR